MSDFNTLLAVKDLMTPDIVTASISSNITDVAKALDENKIGSIVLTDDNGQVAGIITESDIVRKVVAQEKDQRTTVASDIMSPNVHKIAGDSSIFDARQLMADKKIKHLLVEEEGRPVGIISSTALGA